MSTHPRPTIPLGSNPYPFKRALPYNPNRPFSTGGLGVLMNSTSVAAPDASTYRYLISSDKVSANGSQTAGGLAPIANPSNLATGYTWFERLESAMVTLIRPYLAKFDATPPTDYAAAVAQGLIAGTLSFYLVRAARAPQAGEPMEYTAEYAGKVTVSNAAGTVGASRVLPANAAATAGAQWCDTGTVNVDDTIDPGLKVERNRSTGALRIRFDHEGAEGLITQVSDLTANVGLGWLTSHL